MPLETKEFLSLHALNTRKLRLGLFLANSIILLTNDKQKSIEPLAEAISRECLLPRHHQKYRAQLKSAIEESLKNSVDSFQTMFEDYVTTQAEANAIPKTQFLVSVLEYLNYLQNYAAPFDKASLRKGNNIFAVNDIDDKTILNYKQGKRSITELPEKYKSNAKVVALHQWARGIDEKDNAAAALLRGQRAVEKELPIQKARLLSQEFYKSLYKYTFYFILFINYLLLTRGSYILAILATLTISYTVGAVVHGWDTKEVAASNQKRDKDDIEECKANRAKATTDLDASLEKLFSLKIITYKNNSASHLKFKHETNATENINVPVDGTKLSTKPIKVFKGEKHVVKLGNRDTNSESKPEAVEYVRTDTYIMRIIRENNSETRVCLPTALIKEIPANERKDFVRAFKTANFGTTWKCFRKLPKDEFELKTPAVPNYRLFGKQDPNSKIYELTKYGSALHSKKST